MGVISSDGIMDVVIGDNDGGGIFLAVPPIAVGGSYYPPPGDGRCDDDT